MIDDRESVVRRDVLIPGGIVIKLLRRAVEGLGRVVPGVLLCDVDCEGCHGAAVAATVGGATVVFQDDRDLGRAAAVVMGREVGCGVQRLIQHQEAADPQTPPQVVRGSGASHFFVLLTGWMPVVP